MQLQQSSAPYIHHQDSSRTFMINVILSLSILYVMAFFFYGPRVFMLALTGVLSAVLSEWACLKAFGKKININDLSAVVTGLLIPLMLPATIPFRVPALAAVFGIAIAKHPFGGTGHNVFNPAAAGYAFAVSCFPQSVMFQYPLPLTYLPMFDLSKITLVSSPSFTLSLGGIPGYTPVNMALGNMPGPMGATNILVILACLLFLISRKTLRWQIPIAFLATTSILSLIFIRVPGSPVQSLIYEHMSGLLIFGAVFILSDPVTTPTRTFARTSYAIVLGIIVMIFRHFGKIEETFLFAILVMNASVWLFDTLFEKIASMRRRKAHEVSSTKKL